MSVTFFAALSSLVIFAVIIELIRRGRLREQYALLWLGTATVILVFGLWRDGLNELADSSASPTRRMPCSCWRWHSCCSCCSTTRP